MTCLYVSSFGLTLLGVDLHMAPGQHLATVGTGELAQLQMDFFYVPLAHWILGKALPAQATGKATSGQHHIVIDKT
jgi:hypothetical protein